MTVEKARLGFDMLLQPGPRGNPDAARVWDSPLPPSTTSSKAFFISFINKHIFHSHTLLAVCRRQTTGTGKELACKPLSSRQEPISSQGQPTTTQTHLQPITHSYSQSGKKGYLKQTNIYDLYGRNTCWPQSVREGTMRQAAQPLARCEQRQVLPHKRPDSSQ